MVADLPRSEYLMEMSRVNVMTKTRTAGRSNPPKPQAIGYLPATAPFHRQVQGCFSKAGFTGVRVGINRDFSLATFWLKQGEYPTFRDRRQAHAALFRLLRTGGVKVKRRDLAVDVYASGIEGAFTPPQHKIPNPQ